VQLSNFASLGTTHTYAQTRFKPSPRVLSCHNVTMQNNIIKGFSFMQSNFVFYFGLTSKTQIPLIQKKKNEIETLLCSNIHII